MHKLLPPNSKPNDPFMKSDESSDHGFSLIELIVVTVIIGIIASIAVLSFSGVSNSTFNTVVLSEK